MIPEQVDQWHAIRVLVGNLQELGYKKVIVRSDQEPAIVRLKKGVKMEFSEHMTCAGGRIQITGGSEHTDLNLAGADTNAQGCTGK